MMKRILFMLLGSILAFSVTAAQISEGKQYIKLTSPVANQPKVLEFFSFYCPHCYEFEMVYHINQQIRDHLPAGVKMVKYHVDFLGPLGADLTKAWAVAMVLGVEQKMTPILFNAIQQTQSVNSAADIRQLFIKAGVGAEEYDAAMNSFAVKALALKQEKAAADLKLQGVPAVFVNGQYMVNSAGLSAKSVEQFAQQFSQVINYLLALK